MSKISINVPMCTYFLPSPNLNYVSTRKYINKLKKLIRLGHSSTQCIQWLDIHKHAIFFNTTINPFFSFSVFFWGQNWKCLHQSFILLNMPIYIDIKKHIHMYICIMYAYWVYWVLGYNWYCSGFEPCLKLRDHSLQFLGEIKWCQ